MMVAGDGYSLLAVLGGPSDVGELQATDPPSLQRAPADHMTSDTPGWLFVCHVYV
jgi:hypothetical protein